MATKPHRHPAPSSTKPRPSAAKRRPPAAAPKTRRTSHPKPKDAPPARPAPPVHPAPTSGPPTAPQPGASVPAGAAWKPAAGEAGVRVRMYRVGFGDFFLVTFLDQAGKPLHAIVDCGVFKGTSQGGDINSIDAAVADMVKTTNGQVALIVVTHRHADHIAGFARCVDAFKTLTVGAVWMSSWENEYDPTAAKYQAELMRTATKLRQHFAGLAGATAADDTARKYMENATGELAAAGASGGGSNAQALALLKGGFPGVTPKYYQGGDAGELPPALVAAGLTCQILSPPPVADLDLMKLMDLQKNVGQYIAETDEGAPADADAFAPFTAEWEVDPAATPDPDDHEAYTPGAFSEWAPGRRSYASRLTDEEACEARGRMERELQDSQPIAALTAAKQLNSFLNNQSLVILFTFKGKKLLFVGDAQAGNWEHWLFESDTPDKQGTGTMSHAAQQILTSLDFYKVGHHGSGNATPKAVADMMASTARKFAAMCSTQAGVYGTEDPDDPTKGTEVPRGLLLDALAKGTALVRSDQIPVKVNGKEIKATVTRAMPAALQTSRFVTGDLWVDCYL